MLMDMSLLMKQIGNARSVIESGRIVLRRTHGLKWFKMEKEVKKNGN
jgi:predicted transcriptional regulator with HTH domain